ncbi:MAG: hypothetical protein ACRESE_06470, partial [Gammaproteobacteria bacterium]
CDLKLLNASLGGNDLLRVAAIMHAQNELYALARREIRGGIAVCVLNGQGGNERRRTAGLTVVLLARLLPSNSKTHKTINKLRDR